LALIPVGYADGFLRALGNRGAAIFLPRLSPAIPRAVV
jgi:alanine racemase